MSLQRVAESGSNPLTPPSSGEPQGNVPKGQSDKFSRGVNDRSADQPKSKTPAADTATPKGETKPPVGEHKSTNIADKILTDARRGSSYSQASSFKADYGPYPLSQYDTPESRSKRFPKARVLVLDSFNGGKGSNVSHGEIVSSFLTGEGVDVVTSSSGDVTRMKSISKNPGGVTHVNMSFGGVTGKFAPTFDEISKELDIGVEDLKTIFSQGNSSKLSLRELVEARYNEIKYQPDKKDMATFLQRSLDYAEVVNNFSDNGVIVATSAGNNGPDVMNLFSAIALSSRQKTLKHQQAAKLMSRESGIPPAPIYVVESKESGASKRDSYSQIGNAHASGSFTLGETQKGFDLNEDGNLDLFKNADGSVNDSNGVNLGTYDNAKVLVGTSFASPYFLSSLFENDSRWATPWSQAHPANTVESTIWS